MTALVCMLGKNSGDPDGLVYRSRVLGISSRVLGESSRWLGIRSRRLGILFFMHVSTINVNPPPDPG